jgi:hypothetical protein
LSSRDPDTVIVSSVTVPVTFAPLMPLWSLSSLVPLPEIVESLSAKPATVLA